MAAYTNKNKNKAPDRDTFDEYITPEEYVKLGLTLLKDNDVNPAIALDLGAGSGVWGKVFKEMFPQSQLWGVELQYDAAEGYDVWLKCDFFSLDSEKVVKASGGGFNLIFGNPFFYRINYTIPKCYEMLNTKGVSNMFFLLKSLFRHGEKRYFGTKTTYKSMWKYFTPYKVYSTAERINFIDRGNQGMYDFSYYYWRFLHGNNKAIPFQWVEKIITLKGSE